MRNFFLFITVCAFFTLTTNLHAQSDSVLVDNFQFAKGPIQKGSFTLGGNFQLGENTQSLQLGAGYFFTDRFGLAVDVILLEDVLAIQILPRYYFPILDNTYLFVEVGVNLNNNIYVTGGAGVTYFLNDRVGLQGKMNNFDGGGIGLFVLFPGKDKRKDN